MITEDTYEVDCVCGRKQIRLLGKTGQCPDCGRQLSFESWQIRHTKRADGVIVERGTCKGPNCKREIYWIPKGGKLHPFDDTDGKRSHFVTCPDRLRFVGNAKATGD